MGCQIKKAARKAAFHRNVYGLSGTWECFYFAATSKNTQPDKAKDHHDPGPVKGCMPSRRTCRKASITPSPDTSTDMLSINSPADA